MDTQILQQLINFLKETSPYLLLIGKQAVVAKTIDGVMWTILLMLSGIVFGTMSWKLLKWIRSEEYGNLGSFDDRVMLAPIGLGLCILACVFCVALSISNMSWVVQMMIAPDYAAIKLLLEMGKLK